MAGKAREYDVSVIKSIVVEFNEKQNTKGLVKAIDMFEYAQERYKEGSFPFDLSYDFWKRDGRLGKKIILEFNNVKKNNFNIASHISYDIVDVEDLLSKYPNTTADKLKEYLLPMQKQLKQLVDELSKSNHKIIEMSETNAALQTKLHEADQKNEKLQTLLLQLFNYGNSGVSIENLMNTGATKTDRVANAIQNAFSDPTKFLSIIGGEAATLGQKTDNVTKLLIKKEDSKSSWDL